MGFDQLPQSRLDLDAAQSTGEPEVGLTLFAIPKPFEPGASPDSPAALINRIQSNSIRAWSALFPNATICLFAEEHDATIQELAVECGVLTRPTRANERGTPILSDAFAAVHSMEPCGEVICYLNSDVIPDACLGDLATRLHRKFPDGFLGIGQRINLDVSRTLPCQPTELKNSLKDLFTEAHSLGRLESVACKDFFLFSANLFKEVPDFLVGRGNWDNWMVKHARDLGVPVVDLSPVLAVIHQNHDYSHIGSGKRGKAYVFGEEAKRNQQLAGGRNLIRGSASTWVWRENGPKKRNFPTLALMRDVPKFVRLLRKLLVLGHALAATTLPI